jgi:ICP0-binding domain of Ubiquitin-specific protease 7
LVFSSHEFPFRLCCAFAPQVRSFRVKKQTLFADFRRQLAAELGVPLEAQRFWMWAKRQNNTFRPSRMLTLQDDALRVMDLRDASNPKAYAADLKLYMGEHAAGSRSTPRRALGCWARDVP